MVAKWLFFLRIPWIVIVCERWLHGDPAQLGRRKISVESERHCWKLNQFFIQLLMLNNEIRVRCRFSNYTYMEHWTRLPMDIVGDREMESTKKDDCIEQIVLLKSDPTFD